MDLVNWALLIAMPIFWLIVIGVGSYVTYLLIKALRIYIKKNS